MKILLNNNDLNEALYNVSNLGFVPTMGGLHQGHISLIKRSLKECNKTIVSIFVNPTQFNNKSDFKKYPRNNKKDLKILKKLNIDFIYLPSVNDIYSSKRLSKIKINKKDQILCAKFRKGHFEGVIDVMDRFATIIKPKKIFMGEKDFQQLYLVKKFFKKNHRSKIMTCKTIRNKNNLALSSRNLLVNKNNLIKAEKLTRDLINIKKSFTKKINLNQILNLKKKELSETYNLKIEYLELRNKDNLKKTNKLQNSKIFIAYYIDKVRLIDNL